MQPWLHHHKELLQQPAKWMQCDTAIPPATADADIPKNDFSDKLLNRELI